MVFPRPQFVELKQWAVLYYRGLQFDYCCMTSSLFASGAICWSCKFYAGIIFVLYPKHYLVIKLLFGRMPQLYSVICPVINQPYQVHERPFHTYWNSKIRCTTFLNYIKSADLPIASLKILEGPVGLLAFIFVN